MGKQPLLGIETTGSSQTSGILKGTQFSMGQCEKLAERKCTTSTGRYKVYDCTQDERRNT